MNRGKKRRELTPHERMHWMHKVQSNQKGRVQFITFLQRQEISPQRFVKFSVYRELTGLQIENRLYYVKSGKLKYCYINRMGCKVTYIYDTIPEWAEPELLELYKQKNEVQRAVLLLALFKTPALKDAIKAGYHKAAHGYINSLVAGMEPVGRTVRSRAKTITQFFGFEISKLDKLSRAEKLRSGARSANTSICCGGKAMQGNGMTESAADLLDDVPGQDKQQAEEKSKAKAAEPEETPEEKARRECLELNAFCSELSEKVSALVQGDIEFESLVSSLQAATVEYDELSARLKRKRKTGELTRRSKRRLCRAGKEVRKRREDLNVYMYYHDINLLMLESPRSYACMLCQNKQPAEGDDGEEYCRFRQEELDEE